MSTIVVAHIKGYDNVAAVEKTLYFSTSPYVTPKTLVNTPPNAVVDTAYVDRLSQPGLFQRDCFDKGTTGGESRESYGTLDVSNIDGAYDYLMEWGFDGRLLEIYFGEISPGSAAVWTLIFSGTMIQPVFQLDSIKFRIRDRQVDLDKPVCTNVYSGANVLPNGIDGTADIEGQRKPRAYGTPFNISPVLVNTSKLIYQCSDEPIATMWTAFATLVRDSGIEIPRETTNYPDQATMESTAPAAGKCRIWLGTTGTGAFFRLGSLPAGRITCTPTTDATAANLTAAQLFYKIATTSGGIAPAKISSADITALDTAQSNILGLFFQDDTTVRQAFDMIANSVGAWWGFDKSGILRISRLELPSGSPIFTLNDDQIFKITKLDVPSNIPFKRATLKYNKNFTVQDSDLAAGVTADNRGILKQEWATVSRTVSGVTTKNLLAGDLNGESYLATRAGAYPEALRWVTMYSTQLHQFEVEGFCDTNMLSLIDLNKVVQLQCKRYNLSSGRLFRILGYTIDLKSRTFKLRCWG